MRQSTTREKSRAQRLYQLLRDHLAQTAEGQQLIPEIKEDPQRRSGALRNYLLQHLPHDEVLASQLASALGEGNQFATVVTGGQVDQILNIARLGSLHLDARRYFYVFRDVRQVVAFLAIVVVVTAIVTYGVWYSRQPKRMAGDFNIAIAEFAEQSVSAHSGVASIASNRITDFLDSEYQLSSFEKVQVSHTNMPVVTTADEAKSLARRVNAHVVIYGTVNVINESALISPKFYVADVFSTDIGEVNGQHELGESIEFSVPDLVSGTSEVNSRLRQRTTILTEFTKALVCLASHDLKPARRAIQNAIEKAEVYGHFQGKEVLYLFASHIARLQQDFTAAQQYVEDAFKLNDAYARAYIAQANIYYENGDLHQALQWYERATKQPNLPYGAYILEKANLGIADIYQLQFQYTIRNPETGRSEVMLLAQNALQHYQAVINSYKNEPEPDQRLQEMAALSYYYAGVIYQELSEFYQEPGRCQKAAELYQVAFDLALNDSFAVQARGRLQAVSDCEGET